MKIKASLFTLLFFLSQSLFVSAQNQYELLFLQGNYEQIIMDTNQSEDSIQIFWHTVALDRTGQSLTAMEYLEKEIANFDDCSSLEIQLANLYYKNGHYFKAKPLLIKHQSDPDLFMKLVRIYETESDNKTAIALLENRILSDSINVEFLTRLGDNYTETGRELSARKTYLKVIYLNPKNVIVLAKLANLQLKIEEKGQYEKAIMYCNLALQSDSTNRTIIQIKGIAAFRKGDFEMAEENFDYLFEHSDSSIATLKHLGISEYKNEKHQESYDHLLMAYKQDTTDHEICYFMARDLIYNRAPEEALYYLELADTLLQPKPEVQVAIYVEMASAYTDMFQNEKAIELYELSYLIRPRPDYLFFIGSLYHNRIKDKQKALDYFERFISDLPPQKDDIPSSPKKAMSISMKTAAEYNIEKLKEELFFDGALSKDTLQN